jgi:hypothetical protein
MYFCSTPDTHQCNLGVCKYLSRVKSNTQETVAACWVCARRARALTVFRFECSQDVLLHSKRIRTPFLHLSAALEPLLENFFVYNCVKFLCSASACALAETTFRPERITLLTFSVCHEKGSAHTHTLSAPNSPPPLKLLQKKALY